MRITLLVVGCLLAASQANAEPYDCRTIENRIYGLLSSANMLEKQISLQPDANKRSKMVKDHGDLITKAAEYSTIFNAICKN